MSEQLQLVSEREEHLRRHKAVQSRHTGPNAITIPDDTLCSPAFIVAICDFLAAIQPSDTGNIFVIWALWALAAVLKEHDAYQVVRGTDGREGPNTSLAAQLIALVSDLKQELGLDPLAGLCHVLAERVDRNIQFVAYSIPSFT